MKHLQFFLMILILSAFVISCSNNDDDVTNDVNVFEQFLGDWEGTYSGGDNGTWAATIDNEGVVTGSASSITLSQTYDLNGTVSESGVFTATIGTATSGATFSGQIDGTNVSGTWTNEDASLGGSWQGTAL